MMPVHVEVEKNISVVMGHKIDFLVRIKMLHRYLKKNFAMSSFLNINICVF